MPRLHHFDLLLLRRRRSQKRARRRRRWSHTSVTMTLPPRWPPPSVDVPLKLRGPPRRQRPPHQRRRPIVDLPLDVMNVILSHLPISALVRLKAVSKSFRSSIRSLPGPFCRDPFFFVFYCLHGLRAAVYQPYRDRWSLRFVPHFPTAASGSQLVITNFSLFDHSSRPLYSSSMTDVFLCDPFTFAPTIIPAPSIQCSHGVALAFSHNDNYKVVTLTNFPAHLQVYDRYQNSWIHTPLHPDFNNILNAVLLEGFLYVLCFWPHSLVRFNLETLALQRFNEETMPTNIRVHLAAFNGRLLLVGGVEQGLAIVGIAIWELVQGEIEEWRRVASMPDELSQDFILIPDLSNFRVCSGVGFICFYHLITHQMVMCDIVGWKWRLATDCQVREEHRDVWLGCVVEPSADLLQ